VNFKAIATIVQFHCSSKGKGALKAVLPKLAICK
jgi:hypothetical protein